MESKKQTTEKNREELPKGSSTQQVPAVSQHGGGPAPSRRAWLRSGLRGWAGLCMLLLLSQDQV